LCALQNAVFKQTKAGYLSMMI